MSEHLRIWGSNVSIVTGTAGRHHDLIRGKYHSCSHNFFFSEHAPHPSPDSGGAPSGVLGDGPEGHALAPQPSEPQAFNGTSFIKCVLGCGGVVYHVNNSRPLLSVKVMCIISSNHQLCIQLCPLSIIITSVQWESEKAFNGTCCGIHTDVSRSQYFWMIR